MEARAARSGTLGSDDLLRDIYSRETGRTSPRCAASIERERGRPSPHMLTEDVYRACHTLSGSSKMAEARHGIRLAEPLDHWLRKAFNSGLGILSDDLDLLADCMMAMESVASHLDESTGYFISHEGLRARIVQAESALDARIAEARMPRKRPGRSRRCIWLKRRRASRVWTERRALESAKSRAPRSAWPIAEPDGGAGC